jgi:CRP/FNR family cyclic AMP-dependent transcriptional regulator
MSVGSGVMHPLLVEFIGYLASAASVLVFFSRTMAPLRAAAVVSNGLFAAYFMLKGIYPMAALNFLLMPINMVKLHQISQLVADIRRAAVEAISQEFDSEALMDRGRRILLPAETELYRKGDIAEEAYLLLSGRVLFVEKDITILPVSMFGEMGMFTEKSRRTMTAQTASSVELLVIKYADIMDIASSNSKFSFYLMHLMVRRMTQNIEAARSSYER